MAEFVRMVEIRIVIDTNKDTYRWKGWLEEDESTTAFLERVEEELRERLRAIYG